MIWRVRRLPSPDAQLHRPLGAGDAKAPPQTISARSGLRERAETARLEWVLGQSTRKAQSFTVPVAIV